jgi:aminopeptidase N
VRIEAERAANPVLLSNGNLAAAGALEEGGHFTEWADPWPKPAYLFALVRARAASLEGSRGTMLVLLRVLRVLLEVLVLLLLLLCTQQQQQQQCCCCCCTL